MPIWKWQEDTTAPSSGELSLGGPSGEISLDLFVIAQSSEDFSMPLQAVLQGSGEIVFDLGAYYQSHGDLSGEMLFDLSTYATGYKNLQMPLAAFIIALSGEDFAFDLHITGNEFSYFSGDFMAAGYEYEDHALFIEAVSPDNRTDMTMDLYVSDGLVETDMAMYLSTIGKVPVFQITYAHRLSSVKHEIT